MSAPSFLCRCWVRHYATGVDERRPYGPASLPRIVERGGEVGEEIGGDGGSGGLVTREAVGGEPVPDEALREAHERLVGAAGGEAAADEPGEEVATAAAGENRAAEKAVPDGVAVGEA